MKKILLSVIFVAASLVAIDAPASAAVYDGTTYEELLADDTLHSQHSIVVRFYAAVFARTPDNGGIRFWLDQYDSGEWDTRRIADFFVTSDEFEALYGAGTSNAEFVDAVYPNVLGRQPDAGGRSFWIGYLDQGNSRAEMILLVSNAPEFIDANPLPSDARAVPAPIDTTRFFDGLMSFNNVPFPIVNDVSKGTNAFLHAGYIQQANATFGATSATSRTAVTGGYRYTMANGSTVTLTNPLLDASGRIAHYDVDGVELQLRSAVVSTSIPDAGLDIFGYEYITTAGTTAIRIIITNSSSIDLETFAVDWEFTSASGATSASINESPDTSLLAGDAVDIIALYDADARQGGSVVFEIFESGPSGSLAHTVVLDFEGLAPR